jgi:hypothetical protein
VNSLDSLGFDVFYPVYEIQKPKVKSKFSGLNKHSMLFISANKFARENNPRFLK